MATLPAPHAWVAGDYATSTFLQSLTDGINFLLVAQCAKLAQTTTQSIASGTTTTMINMTSVYDTDTMVSGSGLVVRTPGLWLIEGEVTWAANTTGYRTAGIAINGVDFKRVAKDTNTTAALETSLQVTLTVRLALNDTINLRGLQTSAAALGTVVTTQEATAFSATRLST